jgi:predicted metal-dependent phosphoesterase TrpH
MAIIQGFADLHTHTTASDGACTPTENVRIASEAGLSVIAITDHDTIAGLSEAIEAGRQYGVKIVPGVEISTAIGRKDIHILGYNMDVTNESFLSFLTSQQNARAYRNIQLIERLAELNIHVTIEEILAHTPTLEGRAASIGRPHFAQALIRRGLVGSMREAFDVYLAGKGTAFVSIPRIKPEEAIAQIRAAGGLAVLAHPGIYHNDEYVKQILDYGIDGIEAYHSDHSPEEEARYAALAEEYEIVTTAGSDFHGTRNGEVFHGPIGHRKISCDNIRLIVG